MLVPCLVYKVRWDRFDCKHKHILQV